MARKLDLSKLTEVEAQHVLHVVQRDLDLRKKEDDRLGELKCKIEEEETKRKFLTKQTKFNEGHCIHCLESFQFLVNSKRRCLDCSLYTCKSCSKFNKKEYGWICDPCRIARIVKTGSLDWFYSHVRSRFKNFGSAKVMHSLHTRFQPGEKQPLRHLDSHYERGGFDNASDSYLHGEYNPQTMAGVIEVDEDTLDDSEAHRYSVMRRNKRLLSVHPIDFDMDSEYSAQSRRQSLQLPSPHYDGNGLQQSFSEFSFTGNGAAEESSRKGSLIGEADLASVFHSILQEKGQNLMPEQDFSTEIRLEINARRKSLDKSSKTDEMVHREHRLSRTQSVPGMWTYTGEAELHHSLPHEKHGAYADMESSDDNEAPEHPVYQRHFVRHRNKSSSQENSGSGGSQSPVHTGRHRVLSPVGSEASGLDLTDANLEEEKLKKKLGELASNISDKGPSSEEEEVKRKTERPREMSSSSEDLHSEALKAMMVQQSPRRKNSNPTGNKESKAAKSDAFDRNSQYRGSLTQRNPSNKSRRLDRVFGKPVMSMRP